VLAQDNVSLNASVSDAANRCHVVNVNGGRGDAASTVDDRCHSREETEKYVVDTFFVKNPSVF